MRIKSALSRISRRAKPDHAFLMRLRTSLEKEGYVKPKRSSRWFFLSWQRMMVSLSLIGSLALGTATYAYVSPEVLPDHPLYGVRATVEKAEMSLAVTPEKKQKVQLKQLERHLQDQRLLTVKKHPQAVAQANVVLDELAKVKPMEESATDMDPLSDEAQDIKLDLSDALELHREELKEIANIHDELADEEEQEFTRELLLDTVNRMERQVKTLRETSRERKNTLRSSTWPKDKSL